MILAVKSFLNDQLILVLLIIHAKVACNFTTSIWQQILYVLILAKNELDESYGYCYEYFRLTSFPCDYRRRHLAEKGAFAIKSRKEAEKLPP